MAKDDYFKIVFVILTELYECKKLNERVNLKAIRPERFGIPDGYLLDILSELLDEGYIKGFEVLETKSGRTVCGLDDIGITMRGIEYLQDNGKMKKVYEAMKEIRDWVPGL